MSDSEKNSLYNMRQSYNGLNNLVSYIGQQCDTTKFTLVEIGSYSGQSTVFFAKYFQNVISIDPFINDYDKNDPTCNFMKLENVYDVFKKNISSYKNIIHIRDISDNAINQLEQYLVNMPPVLVVYIDGLHTYDQVTKDIINYYPIIKPNGYLCGHDYHEQAWQQVYNAVNNFKIPDITFSDTSWLINKNA